MLHEPFDFRESQILRCDDFVLPWAPSRASFTMESQPKGGPFTDGRYMVSREEISTTNCTQALD